MNVLTIKKRILQSLIDQHIVNEKHTSEVNVLKCLQKDARGDGKKALKQLEKDGYVLFHPTSYGKQISLNPAMFKEIRELLES